MCVRDAVYRGGNVKYNDVSVFHLFQSLTSDPQAKELFKQESQRFLDQCRLKECDENCEIIKQDSDTPHLYLLLWGRVRVDRRFPDSRRAALLAYRVPGDLLGEMLLFGEEKHSASVIAMEGCVLVDLNPTLDPKMTEFVKFANEASNNMWRRIAHCLANKLKRHGVSMMIFQREMIASRLAYKLLQLLEDHPGDTTGQIGIKLSAFDLARQTTADERSIHRHLKILSGDNSCHSTVVSKENDYFTVVDRDLLQKYAETSGKSLSSDK